MLFAFFRGIPRRLNFICRRFGTLCLYNYHICLYRVFNLKVDRQISCKYFTSDAIYNGSVGMTYYYMCRSWQDCCRKERTGLGHPYQLNQSTVSAGV
jgi:hypothetical protein